MIQTIIILVGFALFYGIGRDLRLKEQKRVDAKIKELGDRLGGRIDLTNAKIESFVEQLLRADFQFKHPAKYKVGDKAPEKWWVVTKVELVKKPIPGVWSTLFDSFENYASVKTSENSRIFGDFYYVYTSTNIKTGETKTWEE